VKHLVHKLPIPVVFIFVLLFATSIKGDFIGHTGKAEVNLNNISMNNSGLSGSNTTQININTPLKNSIEHVIIIVMENKGYEQVIDSGDAPYQNQLAKNYSSASKYYGVYPDSLPNYISIISGYPYLTEDKEPNTMSPLKEHTIVNLLQSKNLSWKGYFEDMPQVCDLKYSGGSGYIAHHNPFVYFDLRMMIVVGIQ
jgi:hypothetical protein